MTATTSPPILSSQLRSILARCRTIAVVGLSPQWHRPSHFAAQYMQAHGYRVVPVNPLVADKGGSILGETAYASVTQAAEALSAQGRKIDMVDCFRRAEDIPPLADEAIAIGASCLWLQLGVVNEEAAAKARAAGLDVVQDRCVKIEHARLFGGLGWAGVNTKVITAKRARQLPY
ncbi:MAG: CoA-binding protein [Burkholderiales bacterium 66-5]|uniref:CoA-binding protein n=1 Tax=Comamonas badia TaxID=265291 RepID=UPI00041B6586|nr:CoA-binding protein [Comamonas badia]OJU88360.1 MAG: CoA-binding protein [Burkholderiales bacterium 66-5]